MKPRVVVLLGAGWSGVAGRPLARNLFAEPPYVPSHRAAAVYSAVHREWKSWHHEHPEGFAEEFIGQMLGEPLWPAVVRFIAARLAEPDRVRLENELRYGERVTKPSPSPIHHAFLKKILAGYELLGVITANYDLLAERTLRHHPMSRPKVPGFYYAGIPNQPLQGAGTFSVQHKWVEVSGSIPLCKLHGSLNWVAEGGGIHAYADCRAAFRLESQSYIVAPQPETETPSLLRPIWSVAGDLLRTADEWIVVGYSAPEYDHAIGALLATTAGSFRRVRVIDRAEAVVERFRSLTAGVVTWEGDLETFVARP